MRQNNFSSDSTTALHEQLGLGAPVPLLALALTHRSFAYEHGKIPHNERLEFLGDSVLGLVITERLYVTNPDLPESDLARMRANIVSSRSLAEIADTIGLGGYIRLGRGELLTGGAQKPSILADTLEAVIGAVYLDCGEPQVRALIESLFGPALQRAATLGAGLDWKTSLQELAAQLGIGVPHYEVSATGPDHAKQFTATVSFNDEVRGTGVGTAKKPAEQLAAEAAYHALSAQLSTDTES